MMDGSLLGNISSTRRVGDGDCRVAVLLEDYLVELLRGRPVFVEFPWRISLLFGNKASGEDYQG